MHKRVLLALGYLNIDLYHGIVKYAREAGWILNTTMVHYGKIPVDWTGDGILTFLIQSRKDLIEYVGGFDGAGVDFSMDVPEVDVARVIPDNYQAGVVGAKHLLARSHRDLVFVQFIDSYNVRTREEGFRTTAEMAGANYQCWSWPEAAAAGETNWLDWLKAKLAAVETPLGILAQSDNRAISVLTACEELGIEVPEKMAVLGIDNNTISCDLAAVPLSSIDTDWYNMGYRGAAALDKIMHGSAKPKAPELIAPRGVVLRKSSNRLAATLPLVKQALDFIWENFHEPIVVEDVVEAMGVSRSVLYGAFKQDLDRSIADVITQKRMEHAVNLLTHTKQRVHMVAMQCGYTGSEQFIRAFKRSHGCPPGKFRRQSNEG